MSMFPSEWPQWLRESLPLSVALGIVLWICMQRYFDAIDKQRTSSPTAHKRPDPRFLCALTGYVVAAYSQMFIASAASRIVNVAGSTKMTIAVIFAVSLVFMIYARYTASEWWSIGLEMSASAMMAVACLAYGLGYLTLGQHASTFGAIMSFGMALGGAVRTVQLVRLIGR
jgi:hypothetical protein